MAYFPHAFQKMLVSSSFVTTAGTATVDLTAGQLAIVDAQTNNSLVMSGAISYQTSPLVYLAQGSFHTTDKLGPFHGGYQESVKSKGINPKYISAFYVTEPATPVQDIIRVNATVGCNVTCDTTYSLRLDIKGSPALRFLTHNAYYTVDAHTGCCDADGNNVDPNIVFLQWLDILSNYPTIKDFIQAKVYNRVLVAGVAATATATAASALTMTDRTGITAGNRVVFTPTTATSATGSTIVGNTFTVGTATNTIFSVGQVLTGTGIAPGTTIVSRVSGGGGTGSVFTVNIAQTVASTTISSASPVIAYVADSYVAATGAGAVALVAADTVQTPSTTAISVVTTTALTAVKFYASITTANYVPVTGATLPNTVDSFIEIVGAYVDTVFGDCSFSPIDHVEYQPVELYASITAYDPLGKQCLADCFVPVDVQEAFQGRGFGETLLRELILSKRYEQEPWHQDPRMREIMDYNPLAEISRSNKYVVYSLLHSVPRKSNPSGTMDNDQYLIRIVTSARNAAFETAISTLLTTSGNYDTTFKVLP
jgi:hypothetical protein